MKKNKITYIKNNENNIIDKFLKIPLYIIYYSIGIILIIFKKLKFILDKMFKYKN